MNGNQQVAKQEKTLSPRLRVLGWLMSSIDSGRLQAEAEIPSERAIAAELGVARNTVSAALADAEKCGQLFRKTEGGRKRYVAEIQKRAENSVGSSSVVVLGGSTIQIENGIEVQRWSDGFLSLNLLNRLREVGKHVILLNHERLTEAELSQWLEVCPAGAIITKTVSEIPLAWNMLELCRQKQIPTVVYGNYEALEQYDHIYSDHRAGGYDLTRWLIAHGCKRIFVVFPVAPELNWEKRRYAGYADAMHDAGLKSFPCRVCGTRSLYTLSIEEEFKLLRGLVLVQLVEIQREGGMDAILCISDHHARVVISALRLLGLRPNIDVLIAGYDNIEEDLIYDEFEAEKPIVTIDKHLECIAVKMADMLIERMNGDLPCKPQRVAQPHELVCN